MKTIEAYIHAKQQEFMNHPFFGVLEQLDNIEEIAYFVPELTFWAMTFQDILRINEAKVTDSYLKKVARHHRLEDAGHEQWFLHDKKYIGELSGDTYCSRDDVAWLYSKEMQVTRDAAYAILAEIYKTDDEMLNIILLLTLESSGHVFFDKVVKQVKKTGQDKNLQYFSSSHLDVELAHEMFEESMEKNLYERPLPITTRRQGLQMIDRCYDAFSAMFDGLLLACNERLAIAKQRKENHAANTVEYVETAAVS